MVCRSFASSAASSWVRRILVAVSAAASCCANDGRLVDGIYSNKETRFRIGTIPVGYAPMKVKGAAIALFHAGRSATIAVNATCREADDSSLKVLTSHLLFGLTERELLAEESLALDRREALLTRVAGKLDGVPVLLALVVMKKDGCVFDFTYTSRPAHRDDGAAEFIAFVRGFSTLPREGAR